MRGDEPRAEAWIETWDHHLLILQNEAAALREILKPTTEFDYLRDYGYSGSATACGVSMFVKLFQGKTLLHINRDRRDNYAVIEVKRF
jgi:hypothetical protein